MISLEALHGGALYRTAGGTLLVDKSTPRVITCNTGSALVITLPNPAHYKEYERGGPYWLIYRLGGSSVTIKTHTGTTIGTPSSGSSMYFTLGATAWHGITRTVNAAKTIGIGTHDSPAALVEEEIENPFCFRGADCDYAESLGNVPLDGDEGRDLVIAPMFQNPVLTARNADREAIRAADFVMPKVILIGFLRDAFVQDAAHPLSSSYTLSDRFFDTLYNDDKVHGLVYVGRANGKSRHWHHARYNGSTWGVPSGNLDVIRHYWQKTVSYTPEGTTTARTLDIRFVMEHTVDPEPTLLPVGGGGQNNHADGHWGARFGLVVFTDEINPSYVDGGTYTPAGAAGLVPFTRHDPCVWGSSSGLGEGDDNKFCHPQMVICGSIVTTFEAPMGYEYVPLLDRTSIGPTRGRNRSYCYKWSNGAPWIVGGGCTDPAPNGPGIFANCVFGWRISTISAGGITWGGDVPSSKPYELILLENGLGVGRTVLQPLRTGWDETCGKLDLEDGSGVIITICSDDKYGVYDTDGTKKWPGYKVESCLGHPDEPFEGLGGTHSCFNTGRSPVPCCVSLVAGTLIITDVCTLTTTVYKKWNGTADCEIKKTDCRVAATYATGVYMELEDYDYLANGNQDNRGVSWAGYVNDSTYTRNNYTYAGTATDLVQQEGSWTFGATIDLSSGGSGTSVHSVLIYDPAASSWEDMTVSVRIKKAKLGVHGAGICVDAGPQVGYFAFVRHSSGNNAALEIRKRAGGVYSLVATAAMTNLTSDIASLVFTKWGTRLTAICTPSGESPTSLEVNDCDIENGGNPALVVETGSVGQFDQFSILDENVAVVRCEALLTKCNISASANNIASSGYGRCAESYPPDCGTVPHCGCTHITWNRIITSLGGWDGGGSCVDIADNNGSVSWIDGPIPTAECDSELWCDTTDPEPRCGDCPGPFIGLSFQVGGTCRPLIWDSNDSDTAHVEPRLCRGFNQWYIVLNTCV